MVCAKPLHPQCFLNSGLYLVGFDFGEGSVAQTIEGVHQPLKCLTEASLEILPMLEPRILRTNQV